jgi:hypothetical protein
MGGAYSEGDVVPMEGERRIWGLEGIIKECIIIGGSFGIMDEVTILMNNPVLK